MVLPSAGAPIKLTGPRIQGFAATTRRRSISSDQFATNSSSPAVTAWSGLKDLPRHPSLPKGIVDGHSKSSASNIHRCPILPINVAFGRPGDVGVRPGCRATTTVGSSNGSRDTFSAHGQRKQLPQREGMRTTRRMNMFVRPMFHGPRRTAQNGGSWKPCGACGATRRAGVSLAQRISKAVAVVF